MGGKREDSGFIPVKAETTMFEVTLLLSTLLFKHPP